MRLLRGMLFYLLALLPAVAVAQVSPPQPYNQPLVDTTAVPPAVVLKTFTQAAPESWNSGTLQNLQGKGLHCKYNRTNQSGSPSSTVTISAWDAASNTFTAWLATTFINAGAGERSLQIYPGIQTTSLPASTVAINLHLPKFFRVNVTTTGTNTWHTATLGCDILQ